MAKKKKKNRLSNDARGYATTNSSPSLSATSTCNSPDFPNIVSNRSLTKGPTANSVLKTVVPGSCRVKITSDVQQTMEDLLCAMHSLQKIEEARADDLPDAAAVTTSLPPLTALENIGDGTDFNAVKLRRRVGSIYDSLTEFGFDFSQIRDAITACSTKVTLNLALDWLCYYIPTTELPTLFTEGQIRESESKKHEGTGVSFIPASSPSTMPAEKVSPSAYIFTEASLAKAKETDETASFKNDNKWTSEQKALLLARYEFDSNSEDEPESQSPLDSIALEQSSVVIERKSDGFLPDYLETPKMTTSLDSSVDDMSRQLEAMKKQLSALDDDLQNEANNYMRSKSEIKDLKRQACHLRREVGLLEAKTRRQVSENCAPSIITDSNGDMDDDSEVGLLAIFEEPDDDQTTLLKNNNKEPLALTPDAGFFIPDDSISAGWTGQTPKVYLEDLCRKEKCPKPSFEKLSSNGCRLKVYRKNGVTTQVEPGPHSNYLGVQQYVAMNVLYQISPTLPLYQLFPPFYRDLWISWNSNKKQETLEFSNSLASLRIEKIEELMQCIYQSSATGRSSDVSFRKSNNISHPLPDRFSNCIKPCRGSNNENYRHPTQKGILLQEAFSRRLESFSFQSMQSVRIQLPIYSYRKLILETIQVNPVTILCAETGSGKTTQCGSFLLEEALNDGRGDRISILCTQPRRIAAMSVAERVSLELGESKVGNLVGYQIRMEAKRSAETRLLFCTTGVILRRMIEDPVLKGISHVIVDEVHERQWQVDVLLVALRSLITGARPDLKLVLMSATLDAKLFCSFFMGAPFVNVPGRTFPVSCFYLEDLLEQTNHVIEEGSNVAHRDLGNRSSQSVSIRVTSRGGEKHMERINYCSHTESNDDFPGYSKETRSSLARVDETVINYDLIEDVLDELLIKNSPVFSPRLDCFQDSSTKKNHLSAGSVLIFLPGLEEIRTLMDRLVGRKSYGNTEHFQIVPLHSALSSKEQKRAFFLYPPGCRKIVISTNVAETSITIPDVVYVIDCGRVREIVRDKKTNSRKLVTTWCSKASVKQRSGRAGRVQPGVCLKLFSSRTENQIMRQSTDPELLRIPLEEVCLAILAGGFGNSCSVFLSKALQPPSNDAVRSALNVLEDIGAITTYESSKCATTASNCCESLTSLGNHLAKLPVDARIGKMLIFGALLRCMDSILTIAAFLSAPKSPFLSKIGDRRDMVSLHAAFLHPFSDFLTYVNLWEAYKREEVRGGAKDFCRDSYLSYAAMRDIQDARRHYLDLLCGLGFLDLTGIKDGTDERSFYETFKAHQSNRNANLEFLIHAVVYAGLFPNVANISKPSANGDFVVVHKSECLRIKSTVTSKLSVTLPSSWITYNEKFVTESRVIVSKIAFVSILSLLLFSSKIQVLHMEKKVVVDDWIEISTSAKTGVFFREIQNRFADFLSTQFDTLRAINDDCFMRKIDKVIDLIVVLLSKG